MEKFRFINLIARLRPLSGAVAILCFLMVSCAQNTPKTVQQKFFSIQGIVTNQQGKPIAGVAVAIVEGTASWPEIAAVTNEKGEFSLGNLANGSYTVQAMFAGNTERVPALLKDANTSVRLIFKDQ